MPLNIKNDISRVINKGIRTTCQLIKEKMVIKINMMILTILMTCICFFCNSSQKEENSRNEEKHFRSTKMDIHNQSIIVPDSTESDPNCCIDSLLINIDLHLYKQTEIGFEDGIKIIVKSDSIYRVIDGYKVEKWLKTIDIEFAKGFLYVNDNLKYIILISDPYKASGLASSFYEWLIYDDNTEQIYVNNSISGRPECLYWDTKKKELRFLRFDFADSYWERPKTRYNIEFKIETYVLRKKELHLIDKFISRCDHCKK